MKNTHLTLEDRKKIQEGLENELSRTEIARNINKDISTVAKEIKNRRKLKPRNPFNNPITCTKFKECRICHGINNFSLHRQVSQFTIIKTVHIFKHLYFKIQN